MTALEGREDVGTGTYSLYGKLRKVWTLQEAFSDANVRKGTMNEPARAGGSARLRGNVFDEVKRGSA